MQTHVAKWGASCAVRLPKAIVQMLGFTEGQPVELVVDGQQLILKKSPPQFTMEELLAQMEGCEQPPFEFDFPPVGKEYGADVV